MCYMYLSTFPKAISNELIINTSSLTVTKDKIGMLQNNVK